MPKATVGDGAAAVQERRRRAPASRSSRAPAASAATRCRTRTRTGTVGPNLDQAKPPLSLAVARVTKGAGAMPSFKGQLSDKQIADVTAYVVKATGGNANG